MNSPENDPIRNLPLVTEPRVGKKSAVGWQIALTAVGLIAIVTVFLFGINHQRDETADEQTAATMPTPVAPQGGDTQQGQQQNQQQAGQRSQQQPPSTTGRGDQKDQPKATGQKEDQPADGNGQPTQRQSK